jgi:outer membrane immunogenic protein
MKKFALAIVSFTALAAVPAFAADLTPAYKAPLYKAPPAVVWNWTGFYIGANGGYGWGRWDSNSISPIFPDGVTTNANPDVQGWFGGVTAGYNWQANQQWVFGVEGDFDWSGEKASDGSSSSTSLTTSALTVGFPQGLGACDAHFPCTTTVATTAATTTNNEWRKDWFATLRLRAGFLIEPTWLVYGTGGLAFAGTKFSTSSSTGTTTTTTITDSAGDIVNPVTAAAGGSPTVTSSATSSAFSETQDRVGFAVGGGVEKLLTQNWSVKAEYLFMDFGKHTFLAGTGDDTSINLVENVVRVGVNYNFH